MSFFKQLASLFSGRPRSDTRFLPIYVLSRRCDEPLAGQVDTMNELSRAGDGEGNDGAVFYGRKVLHTTGERRCFDQVEVQLWFDRNKALLRHEVSGGRWLDEAAYEAELERFNAPPEEEEAEQIEE